MVNIFTEFIEKSEEEIKERFKDYPEILCTKLNMEKLSMNDFPERQTKFAAAYDLYVPYSITIFPGESRLINFGWRLEMKDITSGQAVILPRSSLAKKKGLILYGGYEFFDYHRDLTATFFNYTKEPVLIEAGERIAQLCLVDNFMKEEFCNFECIEKVSESLIEFDLPSQKKNQTFNFYSLEDTFIEPGKVTLFKTGLKCKLAEDEVLLLDLNNTSGVDVILANCIGVVDSDYYDNPSNEGEIGFLLLNLGYMPYHMNKGDLLGIGWIGKYHTLEGDVENGEREGGFGST